jgi:hypothetical protein
MKTQETGVAIVNSGLRQQFRHDVQMFFQVEKVGREMIDATSCLHQIHLGVDQGSCWCLLLLAPGGVRTAKVDRECVDPNRQQLGGVQGYGGASGSANPTQARQLNASLRTAGRVLRIDQLWRDRNDDII